MDKDQFAQVAKDNILSASEWRERRQPDWTENYTLYRDKIVTNRLTQRQSVNLPLMKGSLKTIMKDIDDAPEIVFENVDGNGTEDQQKEIYYNEYWQKCKEHNKLVIRDIIDKKNVLLYGRSFKKLNIRDGKFEFTIEDPQDVLVDRFVDPADIDTARFVCHEHIFKPLSELEANPDYDVEVIQKLKTFYATERGLFKADENAENLRARNERMKAMGAADVDNPIVGETYVELKDVFMKIFDSEIDDEQIYFGVMAEPDAVDDEGNNPGGMLFHKPLEEVIGETEDHYWRKHFPFTSWADDIENTDFWSDAVADILRTPNKVLNAWISQLVENRTLRNFGMQYYDATANTEFVPQTFTPIPWGWYPVPGNPNEIIKRVDIPDLSDSLDEVIFIVQMAEKATAATATSQGAPTERKITLGEIQIIQANAMERVQSMRIFYMESWKDFGRKYQKMVEAASDKLDGVDLEKKGYRGNMFTKHVEPSDWKNKKGFRVVIKTRAEQIGEISDQLQVLNAIKTVMPNNRPLAEIYQEKLLTLARLNPDEMKRVMDWEREEQKKLDEQALVDTTVATPADGTDPNNPQPTAGPDNVPQGPQPTPVAPNGPAPMPAGM